MDPILLALIGAVAFATFHHYWHWRLDPTDRLSFWTAMWCGSTLFLLVFHLIMFSSQRAGLVQLGARGTWVGTLLVTVAAMGHANAVAERRGRRSLMIVLGAVAVLTAGLCATSWFLTWRLYLRMDLLGRTTWTPVPGPLLVVVTVWIFGVLVYASTRVWQAPTLSAGERRTLVGAAVLYALASVNDVLFAARVIHSVLLSDVAFCVMALRVTHLFGRRHQRLRSRLEDEVLARTSELEGLVRAGRTVMAGLDLDATLERIVDEAARIARTPHVNVMLLDPVARVLRLAAASRGPWPSGLEVSMEGTYSGIVATTGRPLVVPDVRRDPDNPLAPLHRKHGMVTYLGLPIRASGRVFGVLAFNTTRAYDWPARQVDLLSSFADQAAVAMANARLFEAEAAARREAEEALAQVRTLRGLLPICAWCKRIRNDKNYWEQIETYVSHHSDATFSHGICPECRDRFVVEHAVPERQCTAARRSP